ncbi:MAG: hypothetical protein LIP28_07555, partial [Deltaproteobacteria bacterium]|nr:hypothetical protein [Deltaproteobacteria bacterium]
MLKMTLFFTFALILAFLPASPAAARDNASERGPAVLERLVGSYERGRHTAKYALSLHAEHGVEALLAQAERDLKAASLPPKRAAGTAHEPYAARAWFCGVLAAVKSDPARESGRPGAPDAAVSRAAAYFQLTETDRLRLFDRTREILATAEKRMAGERELRMV